MCSRTDIYSHNMILPYGNDSFRVSKIKFSGLLPNLSQYFQLMRCVTFNPPTDSKTGRDYGASVFKCKVPQGILDITLTNFQVTFTLNMRQFTHIDSFRIFAYNKNQMFLPNQDKIFGSQYLKIDPPSNTHSKSYSQEYAISRTHWMHLDNEDSRCNSHRTEENTTKCINEYLWKNVGCSMGLQGSISGLKK